MCICSHVYILIDTHTFLNNYTSHRLFPPLEYLTLTVPPKAKYYYYSAAHFLDMEVNTKKGQNLPKEAESDSAQSQGES